MAKAQAFTILWFSPQLSACQGPQAGQSGQKLMTQYFSLAPVWPCSSCAGRAGAVLSDPGRSMDRTCSTEQRFGGGEGRGPDAKKGEKEAEGRRWQQAEVGRRMQQQQLQPRLQVGAETQGTAAPVPQCPHTQF